MKVSWAKAGIKSLQSQRIRRDATGPMPRSRSRSCWRKAEQTVKQNTTMLMRDADYRVPAPVLDLVGPGLLAREAPRAAGQTTSPRKAAAARRNGRKGGRPKRVTKR